MVAAARTAAHAGRSGMGTRCSAGSAQDSSEASNVAADVPRNARRFIILDLLLYGRAQIESEKCRREYTKNRGDA